MAAHPEIGPSVKGTLFGAVVSDLKALIEKGAIARDEIERALPDDVLAFLDAPVVDSEWYPVAVFGRLIDLLWEHQGNREPEFMVSAGRVSAEQLVNAGSYTALNTKADRWGGTVLHAMTTVAGALYNFMTWRPLLTSDPRQFSIEVTGATDWPECLRYASEGFIAFLSERASGMREARVQSARQTPDRIVFQVEIGQR